MIEIFKGSIMIEIFKRKRQADIVFNKNPMGNSAKGSVFSQQYDIEYARDSNPPETPFFM